MSRASGHGAVSASRAIVATAGPALREPDGGMGAVRDRPADGSGRDTSRGAPPPARAAGVAIITGEAGRAAEPCAPRAKGSAIGVSVGVGGVVSDPEPPEPVDTGKSVWLCDPRRVILVV